MLCLVSYISKSLDHYYTVYFNTETQWEKPDGLQQANSSEQTATSSEEQMTYQCTTTASIEGDTGTDAGVKRSSSDDNSTSDRGSEVKRPYDGRSATAEEGPMAPGQLFIR